MIQVKNVSKKYGEQVTLNNVSLSIGQGMNFVIGSSGSGKTTLFKIMSGMDKNYEGDVYFDDKNIKDLHQKEKSALFNSTIGFVWQEFNLIESYSVMDNILLPTQTKQVVDRKKAQELIVELRLKHVANKQVKFLSGGQKQRVAIARELMKDPKILLADEPTSALDKQSATDIMNLLRNIAHDRTVVVITHDTSYITQKDTIFELDKGELLSQYENSENIQPGTLHIPTIKLPIKNTTSIVKTGLTYHKGRFITSLLSILISTCFLLSISTNFITSSSQSEFNKLFDTYGKSVLDLSIVNSFTGASGTDKDNKDNPNTDVNQNIKGLYELYKDDTRVEFISYLKSFNNISIQAGDKKYAIESSGNAPVMNSLKEGRLANGSSNEIVVPESFVKEMNISNKEAIGKKVTFHGEAVKWKGDDPTFHKVSTDVEIVGVIDASVITVFEGKKYEYPINDSFFFSKAALESLLKNTGIDLHALDFMIRAKSPKDMISLKDELNKKGLVPIGNFEVMEDFVRLSSESNKHSKVASEYIVLLSIVMVAAVSLMSSFLRRKEYAIFKISGFSNGNLRVINAVEACIQLLSSCVLITLLSPIINVISEQLFGMQIMTFKNTGMILLLLTCVNLLSYILSDIVCETTNVMSIFKKDERA